MKTKLVITLFLLLAIMMGGAFLLAQETGEGTDAMQPANGFVRAHLVNIIGPNRYTLIINDEEVVVALMGLDFENADFYIFDQKHYQYAEWLLMDYVDVWVDYDPNRTTEKGTPLVYFYYGPFDTEVWEDSRTDVDNDGNSGQSDDVKPNNVNYWGEDVDNYDHSVNEPFLDDPEFSSVFQNWGPVYDPTSHGMEYVDENGRKWYLRDLNKLMLLSGYAEVDMDSEYDRKAEFVEAMNKAKWCRRGMWSILLPPNPDNEEVCGIKSKN
jgi:hypothetical protein